MPTFVEEHSSHSSPLSSSSSSSLSRGVYNQEADLDEIREFQPLLSNVQPTINFGGVVARDRSSEGSQTHHNDDDPHSRYNSQTFPDYSVVQTFHSSDEDSIFTRIMEKVRSSKASHWLSKLAVESEPG